MLQDAANGGWEASELPVNYGDGDVKFKIKLGGSSSDIVQIHNRGVSDCDFKLNYHENGGNSEEEKVDLIYPNDRPSGVTGLCQDNATS